VKTQKNKQPRYGYGKTLINFEVEDELETYEREVSVASDEALAGQQQIFNSQACARIAYGSPVFKDTQVARNLIIRYPDKPSHLYRYARRAHLDEARKAGRFRIAPAAGYRDLLRDEARQDDELVRIRHSDSNDVQLKLLRSGQVLPVIGPVTYRSELHTDYYILCLSTEPHNEHFTKFAGADACLAINDVDAFRGRLCDAFERVLPGWGAVDDMVEYGGAHRLGPAFSKPLKYFPQFEWRFAWIPQQKTPALEAIFIEAGSLEDITSIVVYPPGFPASR